MTPLISLFIYRAWKLTRDARRRPTPLDEARASPTRPRACGSIARVAAYALTVTGALVGLGAHKAHADAGEAALSLGRELGPLTEGAAGAGATVRLNDQPFHVAETSADQGVAEVLDRYERACVERPGAFADLFHTVPPRGDVHGVPYELSAAFARGVVRNGTDREGVVVCLVASATGERRGVAEALRAFSASLDLGDLGELRYAYARRVAGQTRVTVAWTDARFDLRAITEGGERTGSEGRAHRPAGSRRTLTAEVAGTPHATRLYETELSPEAVTAHYDHELGRAGFRRVTPSSPVHLLRAYFREDLQVLVAVRREGARTVFAVTESASPSRAFAGANDASVQP